MNFTVFPNPTQGEIKIEVESDISTEAGLKLANIYGQVLCTKKIGISAGSSDFFLVDARVLPVGVYLITLETEMEIVSKKLVINK